MLARPDTKVRWSFLCKTMGPSRRRVRTASVVLKNCVRQPDKDFCNKICTKRTSGDVCYLVDNGGKADIAGEARFGSD